MNIDREAKDYTSDDIEDVRRQMVAHRDRLSLSYSDLARRIGGVSGSTLNLFMAGKYAETGGRADNVAWKCNRYLLAEANRQEMAMQKAIVPDFQMTPTAQRITSQLAWAQEGEMGAVVGAAGLSKTATARRYCATNPNAFMVTAAPTTRAPRAVLASLAQATGRGVTNRIVGQDVFETIVERLTDLRALVVVDEVQRLTDKALDLLCALHDASQCGVILMGNPTVLGRVETSTARPEFAQLASRLSWVGSYRGPMPGDVTVLADAWGVPVGPMRELLERIAEQPGHLRSVTQVLKTATRIARAEDEDLTLSHLKAVWARRSQRSLAA